MKAVEQFLVKTGQAAEQLEGFEREIDDRRERLMDVIGGVEQALKLDIDHQRHGKVLQTRMSQVAERIEGATRNWWGAVEEQVDQAEFVSLFDRSVIVMVYGKVNSGKSTLGNFLAGLPMEGLEENPYQGVKPVFWLHAEQDGELKSREKEPGFRAGVTETTREIQEFTLGGMSWVDSPGIHSMTKENEALAKKFVDAAELVVFLTNSESPARASDMEELEALVGAGKPTMIVVTKFDEVVQDIDPVTGELIEARVLLPEKAREEQESWIEEQVQQARIGEILQERRYEFVSTLIAEEAVRKGDSGLFEESGLAGFYDQLGAVLSEEALELKRRNPRRNFNRLVENILGGRRGSSAEATLDGIIAHVEEAATFLAGRRREMQGLAGRVTSRALAAAAPEVEAVILEAHDRVAAKREREGAAMQQIKEQVTEVVGRHLQKELAEQLARAMRDIIEYSEEFSVEGLEVEVPPVEDLMEEIKVSMEPLYGGSGAAIGGIVGGAVGTVVPGAGNLLGGVIGGVIGSALGGLLGVVVAPMKTQEMKVGTNVHEVIEKTLRDLQRKVAPEVVERLDYLGTLYFEPLEWALIEAKQKLEGAVDELLALRYVEAKEVSGRYVLDE